MIQLGLFDSNISDGLGIPTYATIFQYPIFESGLGIVFIVYLLTVLGFVIYIKYLIALISKRNGHLQQERKLCKAIMNAVPMGLSIKNNQGCFMACNEKYAYGLCISSADQLEGKRLDELDTSNSEWNAINNIRNQNNNSDHCFEDVMVAVQQGLPSKWFRIQRMPLTVDSDQNIGELEMIEDITEWKNHQINSTRYEEILNSLSNIIELLGRTSHQNEINQLLISQINKLIGSDAGIIWEVETSDSGELFFHLLTQRGVNERIDTINFSVPKKMGNNLHHYKDICQRVAVQGTPLSSFQLADANASEKFPSFRMDVVSYLFVPVSVIHIGVVAVVCLLNFKEDEEETIIADLAPFVSLTGYVLMNNRTVKMKQHIENALSHSNRQLMSLMDNLPGVVFTCINNADRSLTFISKGSQLLTGYPSERFLMQEIGLQDLIHPEDRMMVWKKIQEALLENKSYQINYRIFTATGESRWVWEMGRIAMLNSAGGHFIDGILMDITDRVERNIRLRESENFSRSLLNAIPDRLFRISREGIFLSTPQQSESFRYFDTQSDYLGKHVSSLLGAVDEEKFMTAIDEVLDFKNLRLIELSAGDDQNPVWLEARVVPFGENEVLTIMKDVTLEKMQDAHVAQTEFLFKTQFDYGNIAVGILNDELIWSRVNQKLENLIGYSCSELYQMHWNQIIIPEDTDYDCVIFERLRLAEQEVVEMDKRLVASDGRLVYVHLNISSFRNLLTHQVFFIVSLQDITYRKELERKILTSVIETEERERIRFAQELHDGLGPILSSIKMYVQWIQMPGIKTDPKSILSDAENLVNEAHRTVREISFNLSPHVLKNFGLVPALETFTTKLSEVNPVVFHYDVRGVGDRFSEEVEIVMYRVLTECVNNSVKYAEASEIQISILLTEGLLKIICSDNGKGFHVEKVMNEKRGLGLFNMKNRLKSIDGQLTIDSEIGKGTQVSIELNIT